MPTSKSTLLALVLSLPLTLTACDNGGDKGAAAPSSSSPTASATQTPSATFSPGYPVASIYIVTARAGVTDKDLRDAVSTIGKQPGVEAVSFIGKHQLRVDMSLVDLVKRGKPVYDALVKLGTVTLG